jgi:hypothetical protein
MKTYLIKKFKKIISKIDWYIKWIASIILIIGICFRSTQQFPELDLILSFSGCLLWTIVSLMWKDRAMIVLNVVATFVLAMGLVNLIGEN